MELLLRGGQVVDPSQGLDKKADLLIQNGRVVKVGSRLRVSEKCKVLKVKGFLVTPGLIDMHVHLRDPGQEDKETIETGCQAAVAGGFTSVMCMPNTRPVNDNEAVTRYMRDKAKGLKLANLFPAGAITKGSAGEELAEIGEMVKAGIVAISDDGRPVQNSQVMRRALEYAKIFDVPVLDHCEDVSLAARGSMNEGKVSLELGVRGMNRTAEEVQVARDVILSREVGSRVHICHISTRESLGWIRAARQEGVRVTCEVTPHHLLLTEESVRGYDTNCKMNPPLRTEGDTEAMLEGLKDGTIDVIATDHAPHTELDKGVPFEEAANGIVGLETAVSLVWEHLVHGGVISRSRAIELLSTNPAKILGIERGTLAEGAIADITVIDPNRKIEVDASTFRSKGRNTPFHGYRLRGAPVVTIVAGRIVWQVD